MRATARSSADDALAAFDTPAEQTRSAVPFTGFPPLREDDDITPVRARPID